MGAHAPARPSRASPAPARARAWRTGFSRSSGRRGGGAGARGVACERGRERPGCLRGACASVGGVVRPSGARRWHPRTRAPAPMRARTLLLSSAAPAAGHPGRARKLFRAGASAGARLFFFSRPARAPAVPFRGALGLRVGRVWKGLCFPCSPHFPHFAVAIGVGRRKESRAARLGVAGETRSHVSLALSPPTPPARTPARWPPHSRRPALSEVSTALLRFCP